MWLTDNWIKLSVGFTTCERAVREVKNNNQPTACDQIVSLLARRLPRSRALVVS